MPPKLLDINVEIPAAVALDADVEMVRILDAGSSNDLERCTFAHFYATAIAVMLEVHFQRAKRIAAMASSSSMHCPGAP